MSRLLTPSNPSFRRLVPEHVFALILSLRRQLMDYHARVRAGEWGRQAGYGLLKEPLPRALAGSTLGIIGYGALAQKIEVLGRAFGMNVAIAERKGGECRKGRKPLEEVIAASDVLVVLCPLTAETKDLISGPELATMVGLGRGTTSLGAV